MPVTINLIKVDFPTPLSPSMHIFLVLVVDISKIKFDKKKLILLKNLNYDMNYL
jgi:hypothetical protein